MDKLTLAVTIKSVQELQKRVEGKLEGTQKDLLNKYLSHIEAEVDDFKEGARGVLSSGLSDINKQTQDRIDDLLNDPEETLLRALEASKTLPEYVYQVISGMDLKGDKGDRGLRGLRGFKGDKGDRGLRGFKGDKGDRGLRGLKGNPGKDGSNGRGISSVEIRGDDLWVTYTDGKEENTGRVVPEIFTFGGGGGLNVSRGKTNFREVPLVGTETRVPTPKGERLLHVRDPSGTVYSVKSFRDSGDLVFTSQIDLTPFNLTATLVG